MNSQALVTPVKLDPALRNPIPAFAKSIIGHLRRIWAQERERRILSKLTERQLRDIGLSDTKIVLLKEPSFEQARDALVLSTRNAKML